MKIRTLGFIIIVIGLLMIAFTVYHYFTLEKEFGFLGNQIEPKPNLLVEWAPIVGMSLLIGGILTIVLNKKNG